MNCNCIENLEKRLIGLKKKGKTIDEAKFEDLNLIFGESTETRTSSIFKVKFTDGKKGTIDVLHNFCPFCGLLQGHKAVVREAKMEKP